MKYIALCDVVHCVVRCGASNCVLCYIALCVVVHCIVRCGTLHCALLAKLILLVFYKLYKLLYFLLSNGARVGLCAEGVEPSGE